MSTDTAFAGPELEPAGPVPGAAPDGAGVAGEAAENTATVTLPTREREMLAFEWQWWRYAGAKEAAIRERFGLSATRYYQVLNALVDRPEALAADPLLVRRLRRMRATRQRHRSGKVLGTDRRPG
jgi:hypothetical protein